MGSMGNILDFHFFFLVCGFAWLRIRLSRTFLSHTKAYGAILVKGSPRINLANDALPDVHEARDDLLERRALVGTVAPTLGRQSGVIRIAVMRREVGSQGVHWVDDLRHLEYHLAVISRLIQIYIV